MTHPLWDMRLHALSGMPRIAAGDDLALLLWQAAVRDGVVLADGDVIVIAQKVVSKAEGRVAALDTITPGPEAQRLAALTGRDPRVCQVILDEADHIVDVKGRHIVTVDRHGMRNTSAGVDRSNTAPGTVVLLPSDPGTSARRIRDRIRGMSGSTVAVIIADTFGSPFRRGGIGAAIGIAGIGCAVTDSVRQATWDSGSASLAALEQPFRASVIAASMAALLRPSSVRA